MCRNKMSSHSCVPSLTTDSNISIPHSNRKTKIASVYLILHPQTLFATLHESITSAPMPAASLNSAYAHQVSTHMGIAYSSTLLFATLSFVIRKLDNTSIRVLFTKKQLRANMENHYLHRFLWYVITRSFINFKAGYSISKEICTRFCCALLCCGYAIVHNEFTWSIYPYSSGLLCWHWGNR